MTDNVQWRNDIEESLLTQSDILQIVKQLVDSLSETGGRPSRTIHSRNQDPKATLCSFTMVESPHGVRNIDLAAALCGMTISMNNQEIVTTNDEVDASTSKERKLDSANKSSSTRTLCK